MVWQVYGCIYIIDFACKKGLFSILFMKTPFLHSFCTSWIFTVFQIFCRYWRVYLSCQKIGSVQIASASMIFRTDIQYGVKYILGSTRIMVQSCYNHFLLMLVNCICLLVLLIDKYYLSCTSFRQLVPDIL